MNIYYCEMFTWFLDYCISVLLYGISHGFLLRSRLSRIQQPGSNKQAILHHWRRFCHSNKHTNPSCLCSNLNLQSGFFLVSVKPFPIFLIPSVYRSEFHTYRMAKGQRTREPLSLYTIQHTQLSFAFYFPIINIISLQLYQRNPRCI